MTKNTSNIHDELTLDDIKRLAAQEAPPTEQPSTLLLMDIHTAPRVFQFRCPGRYEEERVVSDIVQDLKATPPRLPGPILVTAVGCRWFVVDGHHRLDAYRAANWKGGIPVKCFTGSLKDARREAVRRNALNKIHMSREEKSEAAWRMYVDGQRDPDWQLTWKQIADDAHVSKSSVARMAAAVEKLGLTSAQGMTWKRVLLEQREQDLLAREDADPDQWKREKAQRMADHLMKGPNLMKDPEITAMALAQVSSLLPAALMSQWDDDDDALERVLARVRQWAPHRVAAVETALQVAKSALEDAYEL